MVLRHRGSQNFATRIAGSSSGGRWKLPAFGASYGVRPLRRRSGLASLGKRGDIWARMRRRPIRIVMAVLIVLICNGCTQRCEPVVITLPKITDLAISPRFPADRTITAKITWDGEPLDPVWRVRCQFRFRTNPRSAVGPRPDVNALRGPDNLYGCVLPTLTMPQDHHVLEFEWLVGAFDNFGIFNVLQRSGVIVKQLGCLNTGQPEQFLRGNQSGVLDRFGETTTESELKDADYIQSHPFPISLFVVGNTVFEGMGEAWVRRDDLKAALNQAPSVIFPKEPSVLMFLPDGGDLGNRTLRLLGWAYAVNDQTAPFPDPPDIPGFCIPRHEWFFHEAGIHTADGGFSPGIPPDPLGVPHARLWDVHLWLDVATGVPRFGICNHEDDEEARECDGTVTPDGLVPPQGSFFYPEITFP
jgi:hypothetical protein